MLRFVSFLIGFALLLPVALAEDAPPTLKKRQKELCEQYTQSTIGLRELSGSYKLRDVLRISEVGNNWVLTTAIRPTRPTQPARLSIEGLEGISVLTLSDSIKDNIPESFTFTHTHFNDSRAVQVSSHATLSYGTLSLGRYAQLIDGYHHVTFRQGDIYDDDASAAAAGRGGVKFTVQVGDSNGTSQTNISYVAADFKTLRREHPREIDLYLRPLLRQFQIESLLAADPMIAWQVFADDLKPNESTLREVRQLLPALDSESFQDRERALADLQRKGMPAAVAISHIDRRKLSDQQNIMLDAAVAPFQPQRRANLSGLRDDTDFLLDCLYTDDAAIRAAALEALRKKLDDVKVDINADLAARSAAIDAIRNGARVATVSVESN